MRIALIYPGYPPEEMLGGGISTYAKTLAENLLIMNQKVTVFSRTEKNAGSDEQVEGIRVIRIPGGDNWRSEGNILFSYKVRESVVKIEEEEGKFDVIECGDWGAEGWAFVESDFKDKLLVRCHTPGFIAQTYNPANPPYLSEAVCEVEKEVLIKAKFLGSPSMSLMHQIKAEVEICGEVTIQKYPLALKNIPVKNNYKESFSEEIPLRILVAGRLEQRKGQDIVCRAIHDLREAAKQVRIDFAGPDTPLVDGTTYKQQLENLLEDWPGSKPRFLGHVPYAQMPNLYPEYDLYILSSRFESFGLVVLEAMRAGLPVLAANVGEIPRMIIDGVTGYLFQPDNPIVLAEKVGLLLKSPISLERVGKAARNAVLAGYGQDKPIKETISFYEAITKKYEYRTTIGPGEPTSS